MATRRARASRIRWMRWSRWHRCGKPGVPRKRKSGDRTCVFAKWGSTVPTFKCVIESVSDQVHDVLGRRRSPACDLHREAQRSRRGHGQERLGPWPTTAASPNVDILLNGKTGPPTSTSCPYVRRSRHVPAGHGVDRARQPGRCLFDAKGRRYRRGQGRGTVERRSVYKGEIVGLEAGLQGRRERPAS